MMAERIAGFAGFYLRGDTVVLRFKDLDSGDNDLSPLRELVRTDSGMNRFQHFRELLSDGPVRVESAQHDYRELWAFKNLARAALFPLGVHRLDLVESKGLIVASVSNPEDVDTVKAEAAAVGIPTGILVVNVGERIRRAADLSDKIRDVPGGVLIDDGERTCTITANAFMTTSEEWGFFTASHCTETFGGLDPNLPMYQNMAGIGNLIGWEIEDPPLYESGVGFCPGSIIGCRFSDASFFVYDNNSLPDSATIARTTNASGSTTISGTHPRFAVNGISIDAPYDGMDVYKMGYATGWTGGEVVTDSTCVDIEEDGVVTWCSAIADMDLGNGDSGAPIFTWDGSSGSVTLVGILWGGAGCGCRTYYTPWIYVYLEVEGELGESLDYDY